MSFLLSLFSLPQEENHVQLLMTTSTHKQKEYRLVTSSFLDKTFSVNKTEIKESMLSANKDQTSLINLDQHSPNQCWFISTAHMSLPLTQNCTKSSKKSRGAHHLVQLSSSFTHWPVQYCQLQTWDILNTCNGKLYFNI